jgi:hypothetical protein
MIVVVAAELMTVVVPVLKTVVGAVHLRLQQGLHLRLGLVEWLQPVMGLRMLLLWARYSLVLLLKLKRTLDGEGCSVVNGLCLHCHHEQE